MAFRRICLPGVEEEDFDCSQIVGKGSCESSDGVGVYYFADLCGCLRIGAGVELLLDCLSTAFEVFAWQTTPCLWKAAGGHRER